MKSNDPTVTDKYRMVDGVLHERYVASPVRVTESLVEFQPSCTLVSRPKVQDPQTTLSLSGSCLHF